MSDRSQIDEGWDDLLDPPAEEAAGPGKPPAPAVAAPPTVGPKAPRVAAPPGVGGSRPKPAPRPKPGASPTTKAPRRPVRTPLRVSPPSAEDEPDPEPPKDAPRRKRSTRIWSPSGPQAQAAAPAAVNKSRFAPPVVAPPPVTESAASSGSNLPPPPEFLHGAHSAELPLDTVPASITGPIPTEALVEALREPEDSLEVELPPELRPSESLEIDVAHGLEAGESLEIEIPEDVEPSASMSVEIDMVTGLESDGAVPLRTSGPAIEVPQRSITAPNRNARERPAFGASLPSQPTRTLPVWGIAAIAAVVVLGLGALLLSGGDDEPDTVAEASDPATAKAPPAKAEPTKAEPTKAEPPTHAVSPPKPEPVAVAEETTAEETNDGGASGDETSGGGTVDDETAADDEAATDDEPPATPPAVEPTPTPAADAGASAYAEAAARFEQDGSQDALLQMSKAACAMNDGPKARAAFRKLKGRDLRSEAMLACKDTKVDIMAKGEGYTGPELLAQARTALAAGDAQLAFDKAHASNKTERSSDALLVKAKAACKLGQADEAKRLVPHVSKRRRDELKGWCAAEGIELP